MLNSRALVCQDLPSSPHVHHLRLTTKQKKKQHFRSSNSFPLVLPVSDFPQERCPVVLAPLLYPEKRDIPMDRILPDSGELAKTIMESSLAEFMQEVGYGFCARYCFSKNLPLSCLNMGFSLFTSIKDDVRCISSVLTPGLPTFSIQCRFRCLGFYAGSRTILFLIPDV